ncbi:hypothetical protein V6N11_045025 [Hibiscus sabdariffa]|uniref:Uncharacterized protein n=2 Tax=Hibiscus sabdariffa TaxID=183260 RepID=A0ABR2BQU0_9ROSI
MHRKHIEMTLKHKQNPEQSLDCDGHTKHNRMLLVNQDEAQFENAGFVLLYSHVKLVDCPDYGQELKQLSLRRVHTYDILFHVFPNYLHDMVVTLCLWHCTYLHHELNRFDGDIRGQRKEMSILLRLRHGLPNGFYCLNASGSIRLSRNFNHPAKPEQDDKEEKVHIRDISAYDYAKRVLRSLKPRKNPPTWSEIEETFKKNRFPGTVKFDAAAAAARSAKRAADAVAVADLAKKAADAADAAAGFAKAAADAAAAADLTKAAEDASTAAAYARAAADSAGFAKAAAETDAEEASLFL